MPESPLVLVVDDTPINCTVVGMQLGQLGCRTLAVASGQAAIDAVAAQPVALVLMDCQMPGMDGYAAAARIRQALPPGRRLPILALTGHDGDLDRRRSHEAGMDGHLTKPLLLATLREALERWLGPVLAPESPAAAHVQEAVILDPAALVTFERMRPGTSSVLYGVFLKDLAVVEAELTRAVADGDLAAVGRLSHKLKGSSLTIGAGALGSAMRNLGQLARDGSLPDCRAGWQRVLPVLAGTRAAIAARTVVPPPRLSAEVLAVQRSKLLRHEGLIACLEAMSGPAMLLNGQRQILAANHHLLRLLGQHDVASVVGKRPGEAIGCQQAASSPGGCGTAAGCTFCGAVQSVVTALDEGHARFEEVRLLIGSDTGHALDIEATASPINLDGEHHVLLALRDIAAEKRRQVLERLFFHDVLNSVSGIQGLAAQLAERSIPAASEDEVRRLLANSAQQLVDEIVCQRQLLQAEAGELRPELRDEDAAALLREVHDVYTCHPVASGRRLVLLAFPGATAAPLRTDRVLFRRVLGNLVKNALEAAPEGAEVTLACRSAGGQVRLSVHNPGTMSPAVQQQIFHRSFSTKGVGRGLGTWSAKLLGERYLGGRLTLTTSSQDGTEMVFTLPATP
jgi:CheY-like chemotaxis protein/signal transduction histidine kinase